MAEAGTPFSKVQPRDLPVSIDGEAIKQGGSGDQVAVVKARQAPFRQFLASGRAFVETYKDSQGQELALTNPVRLVCTASDMRVSQGQSSLAASRDLFMGLHISASRLAIFTDDQLLAFLAWNHVFVSLRYESNADLIGFVIGNSRELKYEYSSSAHEKIDWVTLRTLRALNVSLQAYGSMLSVVDAFDKAAGFADVCRQKVH